MYPSVKFCRPIMSWLLASAIIFVDIAPSSAKRLSPLIRMYYGIQYATSRSVLSSFSSHCTSLSVVSISSHILFSLGHLMMCADVSRHAQLGQQLFGESLPEYCPTCTRVPKKPEFCFEHHTLYMSNLFWSAKSKSSQLTSSKHSDVHGCAHCVCRYLLTTSLLAWNQIAWEMLPVILSPRTTRAVSLSLGENYVGCWWYPLVIVVVSTAFASVSHTQFISWISVRLSHGRLFEDMPIGKIASRVHLACTEASLDICTLGTWFYPLVVVVRH